MVRLNTTSVLALVLPFFLPGLCLAHETKNLSSSGNSPTTARFGTAKNLTGPDCDGLQCDTEKYIEEAGPIRADGRLKKLPARVDIRCRYGYINRKKTRKMYRIFLGPRLIRYEDWCVNLERLIEQNCDNEELSKEDVNWLRCDMESKDVLWKRGYAATFQLRARREVNTTCAQMAVEESVPGSIIDWMGQIGCYEASGGEIEL